jgi:predicted O-methyltransferase YrrM
MLKINYKDLLEIDMSFLEKFFIKKWHIEGAYNNKIPTIEHYRLLTYLSFQFNNTTIIDAGTHDGISALCLSQNPNNKVISYDIENKDFSKIIRPDLQHTPFGKNYPNLTFKNLDINNESDSLINSAGFIFLDISHNGKDEMQFSNKLEQINYNGYVLCDDVDTNMFPLRVWFESINRNKYHLTEIGHLTGSGLVDFGNNGVEIDKTLV